MTGCKLLYILDFSLKSLKKFNIELNILKIIFKLKLLTNVVN